MPPAGYSTRVLDAGGHLVGFRFSPTDPAERAEAMADAIASELVEGVATKGDLERD